MADIFSKKKRSEIMSKIRGRETAPEVAVRKFLFSEGFRFRKNVKKMPGTPDIVLPKYNTVIFIHGCFWHRHRNCKKAQLPETRSEFWGKKINENVERDKKNIRKLKEAGWKVIVLWQCQLKKKQSERWQKSLVKKLI
ncbi:MAG: DNA mismatch endonuclease Vsr [Nitrospirae bacterium]|nr:DNA mismatch endonuclease Vsr [Nitrospirota bacterium]MCL5978825.1 DNA mismatch endonuclease Vsr [Nitrospirota bacterium]